MNEEILQMRIIAVLLSLSLLVVGVSGCGEADPKDTPGFDQEAYDNPGGGAMMPADTGGPAATPPE